MGVSAANLLHILKIYVCTLTNLQANQCANNSDLSYPPDNRSHHAVLGMAEEPLPSIFVRESGGFCIQVDKLVHFPGIGIHKSTKKHVDKLVHFSEFF